jgi:hypothetical protein
MTRSASHRRRRRDADVHGFDDPDDMANGALHEDLSRGKTVEGSSDRSFGLTIGAFCILAGGIRVWSGGAAAVYWLAAGALLLTLAITAPRTLRLPNRLWFRFGLVLYRVVNPLVMGLLFFLVLTPLALAMRLAGRRPLQLGSEPDSPSYWIERRPPGPEPETMRRQF